jgi:predicted kinase
MARAVSRASKGLVVAGGTVIEFCGLPATGKSTLAARLAADLGAVLLRIDEIEAAMRRHGLTPRQTGITAYGVAHDVAANQLRRSLTVIVDAVSPVEEARAGWRELARATGSRHLVIETRCTDLIEHRHRVDSRPADIPGWVYPDWQAVQDRRHEYQPRTDTRLVIDTDRPIPVCTEEVLAYVTRPA